MKTQTKLTNVEKNSKRRGSTLLIVLSLLSILAFLGMVFYTLASQERAAAEFFSEAAKTPVVSPDDPFPHALRQILLGPTNFEKNSVLYSPTQRHSVVSNMVGNDLAAFTGIGNRTIYQSDNMAPDYQLPMIDNNYDGDNDFPIATVDQWLNPLNYVDSYAAWGDVGSWAGGTVNEADLRTARQGFNQPDAPYTYPDINNLFLAFRGWAIRDNGSSVTDPTLRYERVPVIIPSFMRPSAMKSSTSNGPGGTNTLTDVDWFDESAHPAYGTRSFRPHASHIVGLDSGGTPVRRFLDPANPADAALIAALPGGSGGFPLRASQGGNSANFGKMGIWTGHSAIDPGNIPLVTDGVQPQFADHFELDSDNDNDGVKEGIWVDLNYPVETTAGGVSYVTMFSFTIYDMDSLIDLNVHGNMAEVPRDAAIPALVGGTNVLNATSISQSNQGLSPTEISPVFALYPTGPAADSGTPFAEWYLANPSSHLEQANMELLWLLTGRIGDPSGASNVYAGKWGDEPALWYHMHAGDGVGGAAGSRLASSLPRPGRSGNLATSTSDPVNFGGYFGFDDNRDLQEGLSSTQNGVVRGFRHPLDIGARGRSTISTDPRFPNLFRDDAMLPNRWLQYDRYSLVGSTTSLYNDSKYLGGRDQTFTAAGDDLITNPSYNYAMDDPTEVIFDNDLTLRPADAIFSAADMIEAHLETTDVSNSQTTLSNRLSNLAPFAFATDSAIKERFTSLTNSLRYFPIPHQLGANGVMDSGTGDDGPRWWEWNADVDGDNRAEFPPRFATSNAYSANDPFRAVVRRLLTTEAGELSTLMGQLPLSINHILDVNRTSQTPLETSNDFLPFLKKAGMRFRPLTEHPSATETGVATITSIPQGGTTAADAARKVFPPKTIEQREYWARRDRQQLARDIYVLLYTMGGAKLDASGNRILDYTASNAGYNLYTHGQLRRMAQFAVNMVDAMDTDDVITKFEFDKDLGNGWDLDDDPYTDIEDPAAAPPTGFEDSELGITGNGLAPEDGSSFRGVVYGVEAQQLTFSEAIATLSAMVNPGQDLAETTYDDETAHRVFLHLELQNMQPSPVKLAVPEVGTTNENFGLWRLVRADRTGAENDPQDNTPSETLTLMDGNADVAGGDTFTVAVGSVQGTPTDSNPSGFGTSDVYVDHDTDAAFSLVIPNVGPQATTIAAGAMPLPNCDLDTIYTTHQTRFLSNGTNNGGYFLEGLVTDLTTVGTHVDYNGNRDYGFADTTSPAKGFEVVLQRRANPNMPQLPLSENPFVEVDRIIVPLRSLVQVAGPTIDLDQLTSIERVEPLDAGSGTAGSHPAISATNVRRNSIGSAQNAATTGPFKLYQPHFDRDFANTGELLQLPVVGPRLLTSRLDRMRFAPQRQAITSYAGGPAIGDGTDGANERWFSSAESLFLQPEFNTAAIPPTVDDNRWYRILQLVEVPSRINRTLGNYLNLTRTPGKLNLNNIRHIEVFAGLIDDQYFTELPYQRDRDVGGSPFDQDNRYGPFTVNNVTGNDSETLVRNNATTNVALADKDRWFEFVAERDGRTLTYDPVQNAMTSFWIPGTPNANPFHALSFTGQLVSTDDGLDQTILRRTSVDASDADTSRHWLEVGNDVFHKNPTSGANSASTVERHQILSKILNNTTTTSNVFVAYGTAAYFEAVEDTNGFVRIGGRLDLDGDTVTSGVSADITTGWEERSIFVIDRSEIYNAYDAASGSFEWQRFIKARADLQPTSN